MNIKIRAIFLGLFFASSVFAQEVNTRLTLSEVIELAKEQSPSAILAKHQFLSGFWNKSFKASRFRIFHDANLSTGINKLRFIPMPMGPVDM
jgi:hypothetical protein